MNHQSNIWAVLGGGFIAVLLAMGIGRFAYTPLLPLMSVQYGLRPDQADLLASLNFLGYLAGALAAGVFSHISHEKRILIAGLVLLGLATAAAGLSKVFALLALARLLAGVASAFCFVAASDMVLTALAGAGREGLAGLFYGGVGGGIVLSGVLALPLAEIFGVSVSWIVLGLVSGVLALPVPKLIGQGTPASLQADRRQAPLLPRTRPFVRLVAAYGLEGFGYSITVTFLVGSACGVLGLKDATAAWVLVGAAAMPSAFLWSMGMGRLGVLRLLVGALLLQFVGITLPVFFPSPPGVLIGAVLFGATFMGIVTLAFTAGGNIMPRARGRIIAFMTFVYGIGLISGPMAADLCGDPNGGYHRALLIAGIAVLAGGVLLLPDALRKRGSGKDMASA